MPKKLLLIIFVITLLLCTANISRSETSTSFVTSVSMLKAETYLVGPVWISAFRSHEDPSRWSYTLLTPFEDVYQIKILMIFYNDNKEVYQYCVTIFDGPMKQLKTYNGELISTVEHTHIGFSALIEK